MIHHDAPSEDVRRWMERRWSRLEQWRATDVLAAKQASGTSVSVVLPALNEQQTVGEIVTPVTGTVSDAMCGAKHQMAGSAADCTRACIAHGSKYALVVGDKVYTLEGGDKATLDKLAGEKATVKGTVSGDTINVTSVVKA